jgi:ectoine hydroxylase-related dioxygenase (phytanoyl-CoA dioxygenase family)
MTVSTRTAPNTGLAMTTEQRATFERDGYLVVPGVLTEEEIARYVSAIDRVYDREARADQLRPDGSMHLLSAATGCPPLAGLVDHPQVFGLVWSILGWNIHVYHSHIDVHPKVTARKPYRFEWHQDGGRQNRELETDPRPRMSVKLAFWLSDVSQPGRGNFKVVPGSHRTNWIDGPPRRDMPWPDPAGAIEVTANPGDAVFFDRRIWHARSDNQSDIVRKAAFFGYTYRWVAGRDEVPPASWILTPVQRQLLGMLDQADGDHAWGHDPETVPLYLALRDAGELDPGVAPLRP